MKIKRTLKFKDGAVSVRVVARVDTHGELTRDEVSRLERGLVSSLMVAMKECPFTAVGFGDIKIGR